MSYTIVVPLKTESWQDDLMEKKFNEATQVYNETLDEFISRARDYFEILTSSEEQGYDEDEKKKYYKKLKKKTGLYDIVDSNGQVDADFKNKFLDDCHREYHLTAELVRFIMGRAVQSVEKWIYGECGKPYFKSTHFEHDRTVDSLEGYNSLRKKDSFLRIGSSKSKTMKVPLDKKSLTRPSGKERLEDLENIKKTGKVEVVRKKVKGDVRYFAHFSCDEEVPIASTVQFNTGKVGVDVGVRMIAGVSDNKAFLEPLVDRDIIEYYDKKLATLERDFDHKFRENNPHAFTDDGQYIQGSENIEYSNRMEKKMDQIREVYRKFTEEKKRQHFEMINQLLEMGKDFVVEDNDYAGWQAGWFGKQVKDSSPKTFVDRLEYKAESVGGSVVRASTWDTKFSSRCFCGRSKPNELEEKWHSCECGVECQRDLFSAYLMKNYVDGDLDEGQCRKDWPGIERSLHKASSEFKSVTGAS